MRFTCQVEVHNRLCASLAQPQARRLRSTLTLGGYGGTKHGGKLWILHQTAQNGPGIRYKVNSNVIGIFTKFLKEGKTTVRLKEPAVDLRISGDVKELNLFIETIVDFCSNKTSGPSKRVKLTDLETTPKRADKTPQKKLVIASLKEFRAANGSYPSTLEQLHITNSNLEFLDPKIVRLQHLKILHLDGNMLQKIPKCIDLLRLTTLSLSHNKLGLSRREEDWEWMNGSSLPSTLETLDMSNNELHFLPNKLIYLKTLKDLNVSGNKLSTLPNNIGFCKTLKKLSLNDNTLKWLPSSITFNFLEYLDLSGNRFENMQTIVDDRSVLSLKNLAGRSVLYHRLAFDNRTLPRELIRYLEEACYCLCKGATFPRNPSTFKSMSPFRLAHCVVFDIYDSSSVSIGFRKCPFVC